ncbi:YjbH domain-containing protein [Halomonas sp. KAO]|nr:YjbH domain-containing protein [Halomonas sp. KAO]
MKTVTIVTRNVSGRVGQNITRNVRTSMVALVTGSLGVAMAPPALSQEGIAGQLGAGQSDFGGVGLMQTPTARMAPVGTMSINWSRTAPYRRYSVFIQPVEWFEGGFRYVEVEDVSTSLFDRYLDKGFDMKLRLLEETRYWPQLAVGLRDVGGTTLFGSEYLAASKRWYDFDFTLGIGWGYLGAASDIDSPLGWLADRFDDRPNRAGGDQGGEFAVDALFHGPASIFGGVEWQTPWDPLVLQLEYEGNDYTDEPLGNDQQSESRVNIGARLAVTDNLELRAGWQRGSTAMAGISYHVDLAGLTQVKRDPAPRDINAPAFPDWANVSQALEENAGIRVHEIAESGDSLRVVAEPETFRNLNQSEGRAARILHAQASPEIDTFRFQWQQNGLALREDVHDRAAFVAAAESADREFGHRYGIYSHTRLAKPAREEIVHRESPQRFNWRVGPRLDQNFGGPDGYLYRLVMVTSGEYHTDRNGWLSAAGAWTMADNLDGYEYLGPSELPRVRSYLGDYLSASDVGIENLQYTRTANLADDWYAMGYAGLLEMMFAGAGAEVLHRPLDSPFAIGADVNWVRQRDFEQGFEMRDYDTWTGHLNAYIETGFEDILAKVSVGRYLAGDVGGTLDLSREFDSGVRVGAWGTWTDADDDFGEGGFDKGLYVSFPLDAFFTRSSRSAATLAWRPLTRDGGARLGRRYRLYDMTEERNLTPYWDGYPATWE